MKIAKSGNLARGGARRAARAAAIVAVALCCSTVSAFEWPFGAFKPTSLFGQRADGVIGRGITLEGQEVVRASGHGTTLVTIAKNGNMTGFPSTLGNFAVLSHEDGLLSAYGNLEALDRVDGRTQIDSGTILGIAGSSAWGKPKDVFFQVIDTKRKTVLNPLLVLPGFKDTRGPVISNVLAISGNNQPFALGSVKFVKQGKYRVYADVTDSIDGVAGEFAPFRISVLVNGKEYASIPFEMLQEDSGKLYLSSKDSREYTWAALYGDPTRMFLADVPLTRGRADISIIACDIAGNERSVLFGVQVE
ncbi:MAG TPA: M23 family peptidase [Treponemataceae bacterium]|nr:M23 family peptidase [Treponemataceae bacterium]